MTGASKGALDGLFVLDLSRILAGPTCTQLLGDLGATVIKVENPKSGGDDTRGWGPHYARDADGSKTDLSAYFMAANRNKRSLSVDIATEDGQALIRHLAAEPMISAKSAAAEPLGWFSLLETWLNLITISPSWQASSAVAPVGARLMARAPSAAANVRSLIGSSLSHCL